MLLTYFDMLCIYQMWYVTFPLRMYWLENHIDKILTISFCCSKLDVLLRNSPNSQPSMSLLFETRRADFWLFLARKKKRNPPPTQICTARTCRKRHADKYLKIVFFFTNFDKLYCKHNWIVEKNLVQRCFWREVDEHFVDRIVHQISRFQLLRLKVWSKISPSKSQVRHWFSSAGMHVEVSGLGGTWWCG